MKNSLFYSVSSSFHLTARDEKLLKNAKWLYFTLNMALYSSLTFTSAYFFVHWHVPIYQFGCLSALSIVELVGAVWWGGLADRSGQHQRILIICTAVYCVLFCALPLGSWLLPGEDAAALKMILSAALLGGTYFFMSSFFPLVDSCVLAALKRRVPSGETHALFGQQRLWGTLGHGVVSLLSGQAISAWGWMGMFGVLIGTCLAFIFCTFFILSGRAELELDLGDEEFEDVKEIADDNEDKETFLMKYIADEESIKDAAEENSFLMKDESAVPSETNALTHNQSLFNVRFIWLLAIVLVAGWMRSVLSTFLPYHLLFDLHQSPLFVGLTAIFRISAETLIFAGWHRPGGFDERTLLRLGLLASVLRVAGYAVLSSLPAWIPLWLAVFCLESLKGVSVACVISGAVRLAHSLVPPQESTRAQAFVSGTYSGLATAVAGVAGGVMVWWQAEHSISQMFAWTAVIGSLFLMAIELTNKVAQ